MQLGTRWRLGSTPPVRLPEVVVDAIKNVESTETDLNARYWTLTWLEGRPVVELDPAESTGPFIEIRVDSATGNALIKEVDPDAQWEEE
ncbi:MAG: hypothetical protein IT191_05840 [Microbacteriaceae bacterium]|nr:hypothetical protein [Microbacteriaceae bacterium]